MCVAPTFAQTHQALDTGWLNIGGYQISDNLPQLDTQINTGPCSAPWGADTAVNVPAGYPQGLPTIPGSAGTACWVFGPQGPDHTINYLGDFASGSSPTNWAVYSELRLCATNSTCPTTGGPQTGIGVYVGITQSISISALTPQNFAGAYFNGTSWVCEIVNSGTVTSAALVPSSSPDFTAYHLIKVANNGAANSVVCIIGNNSATAIATIPTAPSYGWGYGLAIIGTSSNQPTVSFSVLRFVLGGLSIN